jgi:hypothetical protein
MQVQRVPVLFLRDFLLYPNANLMNAATRARFGRGKIYYETELRTGALV